LQGRHELETTRLTRARWRASFPDRGTRGVIVEDVSQLISDLSARVSALEAENARLRAHEAPAVPAEDAAGFSRRNALRLGGLAAAGAAGYAFLRPTPAGATTGAMQFGSDNDAGTDGTGLTSSNSTDTLHLGNTSTGEGVH